MLRKSTCSGDSTYRRSSLRACLREARSMIHRLLQMLDKVLRNAHEAYLCELAQNVAITIEEIVNGHALMSGQIPIRLVTRARQTPHCCLASRKPLLLSSEVADGGFLSAWRCRFCSRSLARHQQRHRWTHCTPDGNFFPTLP